MPFDLDTWRAQTRQIVEVFARDPDGTIAQTRASTLYGFLLGSMMPPIVATYTNDPSGVIQVLIDTAGAVGAQLIVNLGQHSYGTANVIALAVQEAQRPEFAPAYKEIAKKLGTIPMAEQALAQANQQVALARLRAELQQLDRKAGVGANIRIEQSGGVNLGFGNRIGDIGEMIGGNKVFGGAQAHHSAAEVMDTVRDHRNRLIDTHTQRLRILEMHVARSGYNTPPEVQTEIDAIRVEIEQLQREQE